MDVSDVSQGSTPTPELFSNYDCSCVRISFLGATSMGSSASRESSNELPTGKHGNGISPKFAFQLEHHQIQIRQAMFPFAPGWFLPTELVPNNIPSSLWLLHLILRFAKSILPILSTWSMPILDSIDFSNLTNYIYIYIYIYIWVLRILPVL